MPVPSIAVGAVS